MWDDPKTMNAISLTLILCSLIALTCAGLIWFARQPMFVFKDVQIEKVLRADPAHLINVVRGELRGTFFTVNLNRIRESLKQVPWVKTADLYRRWPNGLEITVREYEPMAQWNEKALLTDAGEIFSAPYDGDLPSLSGADHEAVTVVTHFKRWRDLLAQRGLQLDAVARSPRGSWSLETQSANGRQTIELGRVEADERLQRFVELYPKTVGALLHAGLTVKRIDLRYPNGLAVQHSGLSFAQPIRDI